MKKLSFILLVQILCAHVLIAQSSADSSQRTLIVTLAPGIDFSRPFIDDLSLRTPTFQLKFGHHFKNNLEIHSGIDISGYKYDFGIYEDKFQIPGQVSFYDTLQYSSATTLTNIAFPIEFSYTKFYGKWEPIYSVGIMPTLNVSHINQLTPIDTNLILLPRYEKRLVPSLYATGLIGILRKVGICAIFATVSANYNLTNIYEAFYLDYNPYSFGVNFGIRIYAPLKPKGD